MRKFNRLPCPEFLENRWVKWGQDWKDRRLKNPSAQFHWHQLDGQPVNQLLLPNLKKQTQDHCSFCDQFPVSPPSLETIEHFRPKTEFPLEAYRWENLYFCCDFCQSKGANFDEKLLRPDSPEYFFERYFYWDYTEGTLEINKQACKEDQDRASVTVLLYKLNVEHPKLRRLELRKRSRASDMPLDEFAYRDFIEG